MGNPTEGFSKAMKELGKAMSEEPEESLGNRIGYAAGLVMAIMIGAAITALVTGLILWGTVTVWNQVL